MKHLEMDAEKKLKEALYHLENMEQTYATDAERFIYELNSFPCRTAKYT